MNQIDKVKESAKSSQLQRQTSELSEINAVETDRDLAKMRQAGYERRNTQLQPYHQEYGDLGHATS